MYNDNNRRCHRNHTLNRTANCENLCRLEVDNPSTQLLCDAIVYLLDNIFIRFGTKLYRQTIGIPMQTNCAPLVADLFRFLL